MNDVEFSVSTVAVFEWDSGLSGWLMASMVIVACTTLRGPITGFPIIKTSWLEDHFTGFNIRVLTDHNFFLLGWLNMSRIPSPQGWLFPSLLIP